MLSPDEFIRDFLAHQILDPETPAERHERYLRERALKGRPTGRKSSSTPAPRTSTSTPRSSTKPPVKQPTQSPEQRRAEIEARIKSMQERLAQLRELLRQLVEKAQERSGVDQPEEQKPTKDSKSSDGKKLTEQEKADAAKAAEEWRKKNPDKVLDQKIKTLETQLKNVTQKIEEMRNKLAAPVKKTPQTANRPVGVGPIKPRKENGQNGS